MNQSREQIQLRNNPKKDPKKEKKGIIFQLSHLIQCRLGAWAGVERWGGDEDCDRPCCWLTLSSPRPAAPRVELPKGWSRARGHPRAPVLGRGLSLSLGSGSHKDNQLSEQFAAAFVLSVCNPLPITPPCRPGSRSFSCERRTIVLVYFCRERQFWY